MTFKKTFPQTKLLVSTIICLTAAVSSMPALSFIFMTLIILGEKISLITASKALKPFLVLTLIIAVSTFFINGFCSALNIFIKFSVFAETVVYTTLTITEIELEKAFLYYLKPLEKIHFPARDVALMLSATLRFIPELSEEKERIRTTRLSRGIDVKRLPFQKRAKLIFDSIVPLFASGINRANTLSLAMDSRLYSSKVKITRKKVFFSHSDILLTIIAVIFYIFSLLFEFLH